MLLLLYPKYVIKLLGIIWGVTTYMFEKIISIMFIVFIVELV